MHFPTLHTLSASAREQFLTKIVGILAVMEKDDQQHILSRAAFDAVIFDLDGVVTDTASLHSEAWKRTFDTFLDSRAGTKGEAPTPFDIGTDYRDYVDGRPRYDGVRRFLVSRDITLPEGTGDDVPGDGTIHALGNRKNAIYRQLLAERGPAPIRSTVAFIHDLRSHGYRLAVVTSSRNASAVLKSAGIGDLFDVKLDGIDSETYGLAGKPNPAVFLEAARRLGVEAARTVVVEDAVAGVRAGRAGGFGCTIGLARRTDRSILRQGGADAVVTSLSEIGLDGSEETGHVPIAALPWAMDRLPEIVGTGRSRNLTVFLDYDGTLTPIVSRPDLAVLSTNTRGVLRNLLQRATIAVISGRDIDDVRALVDVDGIVYAGDHGFRIAMPNEKDAFDEHGADFRPILNQVQKELTATLADIPGILLEPKFASLAVHYRLVADADVMRVETAVESAIASHRGLCKSLGKKVFEIRPDIDWDKGKALLELMEALGIHAEDSLIIYIGDDLTDEDAFRALPNQGVGIVVADGATRLTRAQYRLADPKEVCAFRARLADLEGETQ